MPITVTITTTSSPIQLRKTSTVGLELDTEEEIIYDGVLLVQVIAGILIGGGGAGPGAYTGHRVWGVLFLINHLGGKTTFYCNIAI